jgi:hypothetical protein
VGAVVKRFDNEERPLEAIRKLASERDVTCPKCGYSLKGIQGAHCPECGYVLSVGALLDHLDRPRAIDYLVMPWANIAAVVVYVLSLAAFDPRAMVSRPRMAVMWLALIAFVVLYSLVRSRGRRGKGVRLAAAAAWATSLVNLLLNAVW